MGGNVTGIVKSTGLQTRAEKIPLITIGRNEFIKEVVKLLKQLNKLYYKDNKSYIWNNEKILEDGIAFNGSTSFIMDPNIDDSEVLKYKQTCGDIDITVPEGCKEDVWKLLDKLEDKAVFPGCTYRGCNKPTISSIGDQINSVFEFTFKKAKVNAQIDFEFMPFKDDKPDEWTKFSHSSSLVDYENGVKGGVFHKLLLRAIVGGSSIRDDVIIATSKSTPENIIPSKSKRFIDPRFLAFSVSRGVREVFEPMLDRNGNQVKFEGKDVFLEKSTSNSTFETHIDGIFKLIFKKYDPDESELKLLNSFVGVIKLMQKYFTKNQIDISLKRFVDLIWSVSPSRAQELEIGKPELDKSLKLQAYKYITKAFHIKDNSEKLCDEYYKNYGQRGVKKLHEGTNFREFLALKNYLQENY